MIEIFVKFAVGLTILLFSTQKLVVISDKVSRIFRISPLIIGLTVVAIGTSIPELAVSLISIIKQDTGLAIGNIIGSNIINVLFIFPIGLFIGKLRIGTSKTQRNALLLAGATIFFFFIHFLISNHFVSGVILIGLACVVTLVEYRFGVYGRTHEDAKQFKKKVSEKISAVTLLQSTLLVAGIVGGALLLVDSVEKISLLSGISTTVLGLTLTAIATSLPELFTTVFSQRENQEKITVGNILGSNIYNLLLVGGIISFFPLAVIIPLKEWLWLAISTVGFVGILKYYQGKKPPKWIGGLLLAFLLLYFLSQK